MEAKTKKILITGISAAIVVAAVIGLVKYSRKHKELAATVQNMNSVLSKIHKKHPEIFNWWNTLPVERQRTIEDTMTPELLTFLNTELSKNNLSPEVLDILKKAGYNA